MFDQTKKKKKQTSNHFFLSYLFIVRSKLLMKTLFILINKNYVVLILFHTYTFWMRNLKKMTGIVYQNNIYKLICI